MRERLDRALIFFGLVEDPDTPPSWSKRHPRWAMASWAIASAALLLLLEVTGDLRVGAVIGAVGLGAMAPIALDTWFDRRDGARSRARPPSGG